MQPYPKANAHHGRFYTLPTTTASRAKVIDLLGWGLLSSPTGHARFSIHADLPPQEWKIDCTRLAPYTPQENPVEVWLKGKTFVRTHALWTTCFEQIKDLFVKGIRQKKYYQFPKLMQYTLALK